MPILPFMAVPLRLTSKYRLKKFGRKVLHALYNQNGPILRYHIDFRAATTVTQNAQVFSYTDGPRSQAVDVQTYNWTLTQLPAAPAGVYGIANPAQLNIRWRQTIEIYNTGASILYVKWHKWVCREDITSVTGQTDTLANIISHGQSLVPPVAFAGTSAMATTTVGYNLFLNPYWCRRFKAVKSYNFKLVPGERRTLKMRDVYIFDQKETEPTGAAAVSFKKGYKLIGGFIYGQPAFDLNSGAAPTNIGTAAGGMIAYSIVDMQLEPAYASNKIVAQRDTTFDQATAGHVWQPVASNEATVTLF